MRGLDAKRIKSILLVLRYTSFCNKLIPGGIGKLFFQMLVMFNLLD